MAYDYTTLKLAAQRGEPLGKWNGVPVYAIAKEDLYNSNRAWYYIVYNDNNALVRDGYRLGTVSPQGNVTELTKPAKYRYMEPQKETPKYEVKVEDCAVAQNVPAKTVPMVDAGAEEFFVRIEAEIDALLKSEFVFDGLDLSR